MDQFVNRIEELDRLQSLYESDAAELAIIYGRRQIGKSELVRQSIADRDDAVYFDLLPRLKARESHHGISGRARPSGFKTHTFHASPAGCQHRRGCLVARPNAPHPQPSHRRSCVLWTDSLR